MQRYLRFMRFLTATAVLIAILMIGWQLIDIYTVGFNATGSTINIFRAEDIAARANALIVPLSLCGLVCGATIILHLLTAEEAFPVHSETIPVQTSNKVSPWKFQQQFRIIILCAAIVLILLGVMNGGAYDVLVKAINICTECIGLG